MDARQSVSEEASDNHSEQLISIFETHQYNALGIYTLFYNIVLVYSVSKHYSVCTILI